MHTHTHTHTHSHIHTHAHAHVYVRTHMCTRTRTHTYPQTCTHTTTHIRARARTYTHTQHTHEQTTHAHTNTNTQIHTNTHTNTRTRTRARAHTHTNTLSFSLSLSLTHTHIHINTQTHTHAHTYAHTHLTLQQSASHPTLSPIQHHPCPQPSLRTFCAPDSVSLAKKVTKRTYTHIRTKTPAHAQMHSCANIQMIRYEHFMSCTQTIMNCTHKKQNMGIQQRESSFYSQGGGIGVFERARDKCASARACRDIARGREKRGATESERV